MVSPTNQEQRNKDSRKNAGVALMKRDMQGYERLHLRGLVFAVKLSVAPPSTGDSEPPAHRSDSHWEGRGLALPPLDDL
ncbi:hypothetical protein NQZ68_004415 [Dissostichus eleginoides]|nr:hypothetical protein NQZ68_004415 [Dissostichus eleginoides]